MDLELKNKRALVLASSRGLGLGIATALAHEGAHVLLCGRSEDKLATAAKDITEKTEGKADYVVFDLAASDSAKKLFTDASEILGGVDILVNNTGGPPPGLITAPDADLWRQQFDMMVVQVFEMTNLVLPAMREAGWGRILSVASSGVIQPIPNLGMSNALRASIIGWSKTLASEVAGDGITVNVLLPGRIHTKRVDELDAAAAKRQGKDIADVVTASRATIPMGRYGRVEEFASVATFLVSGPASYITGSVVRCDGGAIRSI